MSDSDDIHGKAEAPKRAAAYPADEVTVREGRQKRESAKSKAPRKSPKPRTRGRKSGRRRHARPAFLASFPEDPDLAPVVAAFERGDYAAVREQAARLAKHAESKRVRRAAKELLDRIEPDPLAKLLLLAAAALLLFLVIWAYAAH